MKRPFTILWLIALISSFAFASPATAPATHSSPIVEAERLIQISGDPKSVQSALEAIQTITGGRDGNGRFNDPPLRELLFELGVEGNEVQLNVNFNQHQINLSVARSPDSAASLDAAKAADRISDLLKNRFADQAAGSLQQAQTYQQQIDHLKELEAQRHDQQALLRQLTGDAEISPAVIRPRIDALQAQRETDAIDLAAKQARSDALADQISKFSSQIQDKIKNDPIAAELQKASDALDKESEFRKVQHDKGVVTDGEVNAAVAAAAEAKAKLLERQEAAATAAGGDMVTTWNRELMTLSIDLAELRARIKALDDRLADYAQVHEYLDHAEQWASEIADLEKQLPFFQEQKQNAMDQYKENTIKWEIISSKDSTSPATKPAK